MPKTVVELAIPCSDNQWQTLPYKVDMATDCIKFTVPRTGVELTIPCSEGHWLFKYT
jgi:hypothetical protein